LRERFLKSIGTIKEVPMQTAPTPVSIRRAFWPGMLALSLALSTAAAAAEDLAAPLEPLRPFLGKTWRGEMPGSTAEKPSIDVSRWERALNGQAVRILHSVNQGEYGGETIIFWDAAEKSLAFYYFTTAGFYTHGTMSFDGSRLVSHEMVTGNENGITEVRSTGEVLPDGRLHSKAEYLQNGEWVPGHEFYYSEDPGAQVVFR
jgi:hypothetical protein